MWGSRSLDPILIFITSSWLEEGLVLSYQKVYTTPLTSLIKFMSE